MPIPYFSKFPSVLFNVDNKRQQVITNIVHGVDFISTVLSNVNIFYPYTITDSDTPEIIAAKYYGSSQYFWLVLLANNIQDPFYDWPLNYDDFQAAMNSLYGDLRIAKLTLFQYLDQFGNIIDELTYTALPSDERSTISAYSYYFNINESKRNIQLVDKTYLAQIDAEINKLLASVS